MKARNARERVQAMMRAYCVVTDNPYTSDGVQLLKDMQADLAFAQQNKVGIDPGPGAGGLPMAATLDTRDPLLAFLYELARDHVPRDVIEAIAARDAKAQPAYDVVWRLTNGALALAMGEVCAQLRRFDKVPDPPAPVTKP